MRVIGDQERHEAAARVASGGGEKWAAYQRAAAQARMIWSGACNPLGISKALAAVCEACRAVSEPGEYRDQLVWAPARLIMAQLGFLIGVNACGGYADNSNFSVFEDSQFCEIIERLTPPVPAERLPRPISAVVATA